MNTYTRDPNGMNIENLTEEELKDFEEDVLGDTQSKEVEDKKEVKKEAIA